MPSLFKDDKFVAQIDCFEHQVLLVYLPSGKLMEAYALCWGPNMMLFQEDELDDFVRLAQTMRDDMRSEASRKAIEEARTSAASVAEKVIKEQHTPAYKPLDPDIGYQQLFKVGARQDN